MSDGFKIKKDLTKQVSTNNLIPSYNGGSDKSMEEMRNKAIKQIWGDKATGQKSTFEKKVAQQAEIDKAVKATENPLKRKAGRPKR